MSDMPVREVIAAKKVLQATISELLNKFEAKTGVRVENIYTNRYELRTSEDEVVETRHDVTVSIEL